MVTANPTAEDTQMWSLESLNKAYEKGYMSGLTSHSIDQQPYSAEVLEAAWEAGWSDGQEQTLLHPQSKSA